MEDSEFLAAMLKPRECFELVEVISNSEPCFELSIIAFRVLNSKKNNDGK